ncbi:hypothetical protein, partial [Candidatus Rhabdochlamydia sp. W815]|uniref:hypothetical protein n=1 Tax=Candidatus Rhabdochlamydia sp. W815 TaxID=2720721 RepID=UPI001BFC43F6
MINIHNISNLEMFDQKGSFLPCPNDLQEAIQAGIAEKVGTLLNAEGFLALISNFNPTKDIKLRIHLTKDGITIQLLRRENLEDSKVAKKDSELSQEIKERKEKIITKAASLFKESFSLGSSAGLKSKVRPLFIPSQTNKEQVPSKIHFDATLSNSQIQQLHAKIEDLQDQLNKKTPSSEELKVIKEQLVFLTQAIHNLSLKQENITYPYTEEYALINKLVDNQQDIYRALLDLLSRNLNQSPITPLTSPPAQGIENSALKEMLLKLQKEKTELEQTNDLTGQSYKKASLLLAQKEHEIATLQEKLEALPNLQLQLSDLQREKNNLDSEYGTLTEQLSQIKESQIKLSTNYNNKIEELNSSNALLQTQLSAKDEQINELIKSSDNTHQGLERQLSQLQQEIDTLKQANTLIEKNYRETSQLLEDKKKEIITLKEKLESLSNLQQEKEALELEHTELSIDYNNKIKQLENSNTDLQTQLSTKDAQIAQIEIKIQNLPKLEELQELQNQLSKLKQEKTGLEQANESYKEASLLLIQREQEIVVIQQELKALPELQSQLSLLQQEKEALDLERGNLTRQLIQAKKTQTELSTDYSNKIKQLERSYNTRQGLERQLSQLQQEIDTLKQANTLIEKNYRETSQLLEDKKQEIITLKEKLESLSNLQQEKEALELEHT